MPGSPHNWFQLEMQCELYEAAQVLSGIYIYCGMTQLHSATSLSSTSAVATYGSSVEPGAQNCIWVGLVHAFFTVVDHDDIPEMTGRPYALVEFLTRKPDCPGSAGVEIPSFERQESFSNAELTVVALQSILYPVQLVQDATNPRIFHFNAAASWFRDHVWSLEEYSFDLLEYDHALDTL